MRSEEAHPLTAEYRVFFAHRKDATEAPDQIADFNPRYLCRRHAAVLREGRLITSIEIGKLPVEQAKARMEALGGDPDRVVEPMTLATIYAGVRREGA